MPNGAGAIFLTGTVSVVNCTLLRNITRPGLGDAIWKVMAGGSSAARGDLCRGWTVLPNHVTAVASSALGGEGGRSRGIAFKAPKAWELAAESQANRVIRIVYAGDADVPYVIERSTNLFDWSPGSTNTAETNGLIEMIESREGTGVPRFFRVRH